MSSDYSLWSLIGSSFDQDVFEFFDKGDSLGSGAYGEVWQGEDKDSGE